VTDPAVSSCIVSLTAALLLKHKEDFDVHLQEFHEYVLAEIGHNQDESLIKQLLGSLGDLSRKMRALGLASLVLETAYSALKRHLLEMSRHIAEERGTESILEDVKDYVDNRLEPYIHCVEDGRSTFFLVLVTQCMRWCSNSGSVVYLIS
jgi:hypothetical protein